MKTISFGGLGDSFIVSCKLNQLLRKENPKKIEHIFVEGSEKTCDLIKEFTDFYRPSNKIEMKVEYDSEYQKSFYEGKWRGRRYINTSWHGDYHFPGSDNICLEDEFAYFPKFPPSINYQNDICIQVAAGTNSTRGWKFDVLRLRNVLKARGLRVALVGTAKEFVDDDPFNFVCKKDLRGSVAAVSNTGVYMGLSGFHTYWSLAANIPNIHVEESEAHNAHYIFSGWEKFRYGIKYGSLNEVVRGLKYWGSKLEKVFI